VFLIVNKLDNKIFMGKGDLPYFRDRAVISPVKSYLMLNLSRNLLIFMESVGSQPC